MLDFIWKLLLPPKSDRSLGSVSLFPDDRSYVQFQSHSIISRFELIPVWLFCVEPHDHPVFLTIELSRETFFSCRPCQLCFRFVFIDSVVFFLRLISCCSFHDPEWWSFASLSTHILELLKLDPVSFSCARCAAHTWSASEAILYASLTWVILPEVYQSFTVHDQASSLHRHPHFLPPARLLRPHYQAASTHERLSVQRHA